MQRCLRHAVDDFASLVVVVRSQFLHLLGVLATADSAVILQAIVIFRTLSA